MAARIPTENRPTFQPRSGKGDLATAYLLWTIAGKVAVRESGCWEWVGWHNVECGYGHFKIGDKVHRVHRLVYDCCVGDLADGILVCHRCDNPPCCNPKHLFAGTEQDNAIDCLSKNRSPHQILTEADVLAIRAATAAPSKRNRYFFKSLAHKHGVSIDTIRSVIYEQTWKHVEEGGVA